MRYPHSYYVFIFLLEGNAVGSPMQPRPSSQQLEGQNAHMNQSPMATQGKYISYLREITLGGFNSMVDDSPVQS